MINFDGVEKFQPIANASPATFLGKLRYYGRMLPDLQFLSIVRHLKKVLPSFRGDVLDVGCGDSPYYHLLNAEQVNYKGIDIAAAGSAFKYHNEKVIHFDGKNIPFPDASFDAFLCTEVLEHCFEHQQLINEMYRVSKPGAVGIVTIPWSARFHYIPHDYFRYTPSTLQKLFSEFSEVKILARGTDITAISSKMVVLFFRNGTNKRNPLQILLALLFSPLLILALIFGHLSLWFGWGTDEDPIGYTVILKK